MITEISLSLSLVNGKVKPSVGFGNLIVPIVGAPSQGNAPHLPEGVQSVQVNSPSIRQTAATRTTLPGLVSTTIAPAGTPRTFTPDIRRPL